MKVPASPGGSTSVPTARKIEGRPTVRMSQIVPVVMMVKVLSSPGTAYGSTKRVRDSMVPVVGPSGDVLSWSTSSVRKVR